MIRGPRGGWYTVTAGGTKKYVSQKKYVSTFQDLPREVVTDVIARHLAPRDAARLGTTEKAYRLASKNTTQRAGRAVNIARSASQPAIEKFAGALYTAIAKLEKLRRGGVTEYDPDDNGSVDTKVVFGNLSFTVFVNEGVLGQDVSCSLVIGDVGHDRFPMTPGAKSLTLDTELEWLEGVVTMGELWLEEAPSYGVKAFTRIIERINAAYLKNPVQYE